MNLPVLVSGAVLGAHGIGHVIGWLPAWGLASFQQVSRKSWALDPVVGQRISESVAGVLYLLPTIGFIAAAGALATGQPWWRDVAVVSAIGSLLASVLFPAALPPSSLVGSTALNLIVLGLAVWGQPLLTQLVRS
ncbi:MAG: hypothetical protein IT193_12105 [Propionibacteriaceae bacterium]|nr:hypothetical protein [Propionibacteriaceae bacterium]